jgi:uncharacterized membrane protein
MANKNLVISIFENEAEAEEVRKHLLATDRKEESLDLVDAVVLKKTPKGKIRFAHLTRGTVGGALTGAFLGGLFGLLLLNPVFVLGGLVLGFIIGGVAGGPSLGVDPDFAEIETASMTPGDSAVAVLVRDNAAGIIDEIGRYDGRVLGTKVCTQAGGVRQCSGWQKGKPVLETAV